MKPFLVGISRLLGSVHLRWALSLGSAVTGLDLRPGRPLPPSPEPSSSGFEAALALASDSSAALAARIFSSRFSLLAIHSGISSPRLEAPNWRSSALSVWAASANQPWTSAATPASAPFLPPPPPPPFTPPLPSSLRPPHPP